MKIASESTGEKKVRIKLQGEFDANSGLSFKDEILKLIADDIKEIRVNLSEMDFIDSPGIGLFLSASFALKKSAGNFILEEPQMHIADLFEATQVTKHLNIQNKTE